MPCRSNGEAAPLRIGIVNYLNSRPLAWSFLRPRSAPRFDARFLAPAGVAAELAAGRLDVGLIPSIEVQRIPGLSVIPGLCVAATREVRSVLLLSRCPPTEIRRLALDENSRTSAALVRILLRQRYGVTPECTSVPPRIEEMMRWAQAALIIGDPALRVDRSDYRVLDLAAEWHQLTGRPFVFAVWAVRSGVELGARAQIFHQSLERGVENLARIASAAARELELPRQALYRYLSENLSYRLGEQELQGLSEFFRRAHQLGLISPPRPVRMVSSCSASGDSIE